MNRSTSNWRRRGVASCLAVVVLWASACSQAGQGAGTEPVDPDLVAEATKATESLYDGTQTKPPSSASPIARDKSVWIISAGQSAPPSAVPSSLAEEVGESMGWDMTLFDGQLSPSKYAAGIRQAIATEADGILLVAVDCDAVKTPLEEAKAADIPVTGLINSYDCDGADLITAPLEFGDRYDDLTDFQTEWGRAAADYLIASKDGKPNVLLVENEQYTTFRVFQEAFKGRMADCDSCVINSVPMTVQEFGPKLTAKVQTALLRHPETNAVAFGATTLTGISSAVTQSGLGSQVTVIGGTGIPDELEVLSNSGPGLSAVLAKAQTWAIYGSLDVLNSIFNGVAPEDQGVGFRLFDLEHPPPSSTDTLFGVDLEAAYRARWGL